MKILLVEDSKFLRLAMGRALAGGGYEMSFAGDGDEALLMASEKQPDLILLEHDAAENERAGCLEDTKERPRNCDDCGRSVDWTLRNKCRAIASRRSFRFSSQSRPCAESGCRAPFACIDEIFTELRSASRAKAACSPNR
jgi:hypothetical protein